MDIVHKPKQQKQPWHKRAAKKAGKFIKKQAGLIASLAVLGAGCGVESNGFHLDNTTAAKPNATDTSKNSIVSEGWNMSSVDEGIDYARKKDITFECTSRNTVSLKPLKFSLENAEQKEEYTGAQIQEGECLQIKGLQGSYTVFLEKRVDFLSGKEYSFLIDDHQTPVYRVVLGRGKYFRLGEGITLFMVYDGVNDQNNLLVHQYDNQFKTNFEFYGFQETETADSCNGFKKGTLDIVRAVEKATGVKLNECYRFIKYYFDPDYDSSSCMANATFMGNVGAAVFSKAYLTSFGQCTREYDVHELMHITRFCANSTMNDEGYHLFWSATEEQILREYGDISAAGINAYSLSNWVSAIESDPSPILNGNPVARCTGMKTFILTKEYLGLSEAEKKELVKRFHLALINDSRMLTESKEADASNDIVCNLVSDGNCASILKTNCTK